MSSPQTDLDGRIQIALTRSPVRVWRQLNSAAMGEHPPELRPRSASAEAILKRHPDWGAIFEKVFAETVMAASG